MSSSSDINKNETFSIPKILISSMCEDRLIPKTKSSSKLRRGRSQLKEGSELLTIISKDQSLPPLKYKFLEQMKHQMSVLENGDNCDHSPQRFVISAQTI